MQVKLEDYGMLIAAETDFEEEYLRQSFGNQEGKIKAFLKHGTSTCDLVGLKVFMPETFSSRDDYSLKDFEQFVKELLLPEEHPLYEEQKKVAKALFAMGRGKTTILALLALYDVGFSRTYESLKDKQKGKKKSKG